MDTKQKRTQRLRRRGRVRAKISGTAVRPRLSVFRSNTQLVAQLVDDEKQETIVAVSSGKEKGANPIERSAAAGKKMAEKAKNKNVTNVVFDRGGFVYTGNIKVFADAAREAGLTF